MKAISVNQPFASLVAAGYKWVVTVGENVASRKVEQGQQVAIYAAAPAKHPFPIADQHSYFTLLKAAEWRGLYDPEHIVTGAIIALATFHAAVSTQLLEPVLSADERNLGNFHRAMTAWTFSHVQPIQPVEVRGRPVFDWTPPEDLKLRGTPTTAHEVWCAECRKMVSAREAMKSN